MGEELLLKAQQTQLMRPDEGDVAATTAEIVRGGQLVVFPTDTVYGVGCDPFSAEALRRLYAVKERPLEKGIPILVADHTDLATVAADVTPLAQRLIARFWPGPLTLIVPRHPDLPDEIAPTDTVAVRMPDLDLARDLIRAAGGAIATTSANLSGQPPAQTGGDAYEALAGRVALVVDDGRVDSNGLPSTIVDCTSATPRILREGPISAETLSLTEYDNS